MSEITPDPSISEQLRNGGHPLGSLLSRTDARHPAPARAIAIVVCAGCLALLAVAGWLDPDPSGMGSHQQLGLAPCSLVMLTGYPCPTCGMTTAFAHTVRGQLVSAFRAQPAGLALALATMVSVFVSLSVAVTGKVWAINWYRVPPGRLALAIVGLALAAWAYKVVVGLMFGTLPVGR